MVTIIYFAWRLSVGPFDVLVRIEWERSSLLLHALKHMSFEYACRCGRNRVLWYMPQRNWCQRTVYVCRRGNGLWLWLRCWTKQWSH